MNIYYINKASRLQGPFDVTDAQHRRILNIGDVCIRNRDNVLFFLMIVSNSNKWGACRCLGKGNSIDLCLDSNMLLFSFDGISKRNGKIDVLESFLQVFRQETLLSFLQNAINILSYRCDQWDIEVFMKINSLTPIDIHNTTTQNRNALSSDCSTVFVTYFNDILKTKYLELQSKERPLREIYTELRNLYPQEFRLSMSKFLSENPNLTIYDK